MNYGNKSDILLTCSGLRPGGTQAYSSSAHPESSSEVELRWKPEVSLLTLCSIIKSRWRAPPWKPAADTAALARLIRLSFYWTDKAKKGRMGWRKGRGIGVRGGRGGRIEVDKKTKCWLTSHYIDQSPHNAILTPCNPVLSCQCRST